MRKFGIIIILLLMLVAMLGGLVLAVSEVTMTSLFGFFIIMLISSGFVYYLKKLFVKIK